MPAYEYSTQRPAPIIKTLREIQHLVKQLDFSEKMKLAASIIESARIEKEREIFELKTKNEDRVGLGYLTKEECLEIAKKYAGRIDRKDFTNSIIPAIPITDCAEKI